MKKLLFAIAVTFLTALPTQASTPLEGIHRIVFIGDSITQAGDYVTDVECWLLSQGCYKEVLNIGLSSETATALTEGEKAPHLANYRFARPFVGDRLSRSLALAKPELLFVCYGMNDASDLPEGPEGLRRFTEAVTSLRETALRAGAKRVVLLTPPIHDSRKFIDPAQDPHERNLVAFSGWLLSMRAKGWEVVDIHGPMRRALDAARKTNPSFRFQPDGIHPDLAGHWLMAREILSQLFGAELGGVSSSTELFKTNGSQIRELVQSRQKILFSSLMAQIGHARPGVPGGPGSRPGHTAEDAQARAGEIAGKIKDLLKPAPAQP